MRGTHKGDPVKPGHSELASSDSEENGIALGNAPGARGSPLTLAWSQDNIWPGPLPEWDGGVCVLWQCCSCHPFPGMEAGGLTASTRTLRAHLSLLLWYLSGRQDAVTNCFQAA